MSAHTIFYITFALQIAVLSIYFPRRILARMRRILDAHPPQEFPKLYPLSEDTYQKSQRRFEVINILVVILGITVIFWIEFFAKGDLTRILDEISVVFFLLQLVPMAFLEFSEKSNYKLMRAINTTKKKFAALRPRKFTDFAPAKLFVMAVAMIALSIIVDFTLNTATDWSEGPMQRSLVVVITNGLLFILMYCNVFSRKLNPHQDEQDRIAHITLAVRTLLYISIGMSIYMMIKQITKQDGLDFIQPALTSLYCLAIGIMCIGGRVSSFDFENENFEVYR